MIMSMARKIRPQAQPRNEELHVGIFWVVGGKLLIDCTPLGEAEPYGDHLTHPRSHLEAWTLFLQNGIAPIEIEYEDAPRGRIVYNTRTQRFMILADRCILGDNVMLARIISVMNLPNRNTDKGTDSHYRCSVCLGSPQALSEPFRQHSAHF